MSAWTCFDLRPFLRLVLFSVFVVVASVDVAPATSCDAAADRCSGLINAACLSRVGAGVAPVAMSANCSDQLETYRVCLAEVVLECERGVADAVAERIAPAPNVQLPDGHELVARTTFRGAQLVFGLAPDTVSWPDADRLARSLGGRLAKVDSEAKNNVIVDVFVRHPELFNRTPPLLRWGPWIGGYQRPGAKEPRGGWIWGVNPQTGAEQPIEWSAWFGRTPDNALWSEHYLHYFCVGRGVCATWNDAANDAPVRAYIIEFAP